jgi:putative transposase
MIDRENDLSLTRQAEILNLSRGSLYYQAKEISALDLELMRRIDRLHLEYPFAGAQMLRDMLKMNGYRVGRRHVARLMRLLGIEALYRKKSTSRRNPEHPAFPYLLRNVVIEKPNHVWCADITYIPMERGFVYLCAILDWATRRILTWRLSKHTNDRLLHRGRRGGHRDRRPPRDLQHRSRLPIYRRRFRCAHPRAAWHRVQHGRQGLLAR